MKKLISSLVLMLFLASLFPVGAASVSSDAALFGSVGNSRYIIDDMADLFSESEEAKIEYTLKSCLSGISLSSSIFVVTTDDNPYDEAVFFADDYFDAYTDVEGYPDDKLIYLIDMTNRTLWINCDGAYSGIMDYDNIQSAFDYAYANVENERYADSAVDIIKYVYKRAAAANEGCYELTVDGVNIDMYLVTEDAVELWTSSDAANYPVKREGAFLLLYSPASETFYTVLADGSLDLIEGDEYNAFIPYADEYTNPDSPLYDASFDPYVYGEEYDPSDEIVSKLSPREQMWSNGLGGAFVGLIIGLFVTFIFRFSIKHSGKRYMKDPREYSLGERVSLNLTRQTDTLIDTHTTRMYIPPSDNSSGGGGHSFGGSTGGSFHTSSGGHTFSGGGRKF